MAVRAPVVKCWLAPSSTPADAFRVFGPVPRIGSLLIKPASALCNLDCAYCFYLDRDTDPYAGLAARKMTPETLERLVTASSTTRTPPAPSLSRAVSRLSRPRFFENLVDLQVKHGRNGQSVCNAMQTNGMFLDDGWCKLFKGYKWLIGISIDGPEAVHDLYRNNSGGAGTWAGHARRRSDEEAQGRFQRALRRQPGERRQGSRDLQIFSLARHRLRPVHPALGVRPAGTPLPYTITPEQYGRFLCEIFDLWWPDRRKVRVRFFDNLAEALAGQKPGTCTMHQNCDSYVVVEYNGDVYPCDFFVERDWKLGNLNEDTFEAIARRRMRMEFSEKKQIPHSVCDSCEYETLCWRGCPHTRRAPKGQFGDLDYFCHSYRMIFERPSARSKKRFESSSPALTTSSTADECRNTARLQGVTFVQLWMLQVIYRLPVGPRSALPCTQSALPYQ